MTSTLGIVVEGERHPGLRTSERARCALCGTAGQILHAEVPDYYFGVPGHWRLRRCDNPECCVIWQDPMVISDDLIHAYVNYYTSATTGIDARSAKSPAFGATFFRLDRLTAWMLRLGPERRRYALAYLDKLTPGSLLDIGCGDGGFAANMQRLGWMVRGTEFDPDAAAAAKHSHGITVDVGDLREIRYDDESFDAITARHVIEHVREPVEFLTECWRLLKPGGRLVLVTPNAGSLGHRHFGSRWRGLEQPRHLFLFDALAMRELFRRVGVEAADIFSSAQGGVYVTRQSFEQSRGAIQRCIDYAAIWWLQFRETLLIRRGRDVGEELVALASKPRRNARFGSDAMRVGTSK